tara:strand:+ start:289 stop:474 length:186 start_codon:yes stop_codon:yes gene_type:complete
MVKNLWDKDRKTIFRQLVKEYLQDGYTSKQAKRLASQETNEIMEDKLSFVDNIHAAQWGDE